MSNTAKIEREKMRIAELQKELRKTNVPAHKTLIAEAIRAHIRKIERLKNFTSYDFSDAYCGVDYIDTPLTVNGFAFTAKTPVHYE